MSMMTSWGYKLRDIDSLSGLMTVKEFDAATANKYACDSRVESAIAAASAAVRNHCGWHLFPNEACIFSETWLYGNGRIKAVGDDLCIQLPAAYVTEIESFALDGGEWDRFTLDSNGIVHVLNAVHLLKKGMDITISYRAGLDDSMMAGIRDIIANRVMHGISGTGGVASETAGGVSVSYANAWINGGGAGALSSLDAEILQPFRLGGVF